MLSKDSWKPLIPYLTDSYKVIALDLRGFGDSSWDTKINSLDEWANDIK